MDRSKRSPFLVVSQRDAVRPEASIDAYAKAVDFNQVTGNRGNAFDERQMDGDIPAKNRSRRITRLLQEYERSAFCLAVNQSVDAYRLARRNIELVPERERQSAADNAYARG